MTQSKSWCQLRLQLGMWARSRGRVGMLALEMGWNQAIPKWEFTKNDKHGICWNYGTPSKSEKSLIIIDNHWYTQLRSFHFNSFHWLQLNHVEAANECQLATHPIAMLPLYSSSGGTRCKTFRPLLSSGKIEWLKSTVRLSRSHCWARASNLQNYEPVNPIAMHFQFDFPDLFEITSRNLSDYSDSISRFLNMIDRLVVSSDVAPTNCPMATPHHCHLLEILLDPNAALDHLLLQR